MREIIKNALSQLWGNKLRTFLTMLGMLIGIGAVIMILGLGQGMKDYMKGQFASVGQGVIEIHAYSSSNEHLINQDDIEMFNQIPEVDEAMMMHNAYMTTTKNSKNEDKMMVVYGLPYNYEKIQDLNIRYGRMFVERDEQVRSNVIIVEDNFARIMFKKWC